MRKSQHAVGPSSVRANANDEGVYRLMVFGLGNVGSLVALRGTSMKFANNDVNAGNPFFECVYGTTRGAKEMAGVQIINFDSCDDLEEITASCTHFLVTIPPVNPGPDSNGEKKAFCDQVLNHPTFSMRDIAPANAWVGFVSTTSVYGNHDGNWVTEEAEVKFRPGSNGEIYFRAEKEWREVAEECGWKLDIFRSSGLYGDGRSALHTIRKEGIHVASIEQRKIPPTSRIHEVDASRAILSAMMRKERESGCCIWNLADDEPAPRTEVMAHGRALLSDANLLLPVNVTVSNSQPASERSRRRQHESKRVANDRMKDMLLPEGLLYPTYREGLEAVLDSNRDEWAPLK